MTKTFLEILKEGKESIENAENLIRFKYKDNDCMCAVGHIFVAAGINIDEFSEPENTNSVQNFYASDLNNKFTDKQLSLLQGVQRANDYHDNAELRKERALEALNELIQKEESSNA